MACVTTDVVATRATLEQVTEKVVERHGCKLHMANLLLLPKLFNDLKRIRKREKFSCGAVRPKIKESHRGLLAACFLLVSCLIYFSTRTCNLYVVSSSADRK
jgi:predicted DNA-binding ribbon-helix-helix protein